LLPFNLRCIGFTTGQPHDHVWSEPKRAVVPSTLGDGVYFQISPSGKLCPDQLANEADADLDGTARHTVVAEKQRLVF
jgi:hypothetical protein